MDIKIESLRDEERRVLAWLNSITESSNVEEELPGELLTEYCKRIETKPLTSIEDLLGVFESMGFTDLAEVFAAELISRAHDELTTKDQLKLKERLVRYDKRTANRMTYVREAVYTYYPYNGGFRWKYDRELRSFGLLALVSNSLHGDQPEPLALNIIGAINKKNKEEYESFKTGLTALNRQNVVVSGERLGWNHNHPAYKLLCKAFPKAIDMSAYCHGLNAPCLPEGFIENATVEFRILRDDNGQDLETDGSGIYNPTCEAMSKFVAKYGPVPCQFRMLEPKSGLFAKGMIFPSDKCEGIVLDWTQIKGMWKSLAKERRNNNVIKQVEGCYIGILQAWDRPRKISSSFEMLENIKTTARTAEIVRNMVEKTMGKLFAKGTDGLISSVCAKDPTIKSMVEFINVARNSDANITPMAVPRIAQAIKDSLSRKLYSIQQGGGGRFPSYVARLDSTIPPGHCVVAGMRPGKKVGAYRFPMILAQGLVIMKTIEPKSHHLVDGQLPAFQVIMNPADLTLGMQGDDDGDIVGLTDDPSILTLFSNKLDNERYHIEPKGVELTAKNGKPLMTESDEGIEYLKFDHRGPVGICTVWRSQLLAVGDFDAARAMSIAIQECIDRQKRRPEWSNIELAADPANWEQRADGWHFTIRYTSKQLENGEIPMKRLKAWVEARLIQAGCFIEGEDGSFEANDPLWWRQKDKRINVDNWSVPSNTGHENLVHIAARHAFKLWTEQEQQFFSEVKIDIQNLLRFVLRTKNINVLAPKLDFGNYIRGLRAHSGLNTYNDRIANLSKADDAQRNRQLQNAQLELQKSLSALMAKTPEDQRIETLVSIWEHETMSEQLDQKPNLNNAFRAICWPGSPIMKVLDLDANMGCQFLAKEQRLERCIKLALADEKPTQKLAWIISKSNKHFTEVLTPDEQGIHLWDCPECMSQLQDELVRQLRGAKTSRESRWLSELNTKLNANRS